MPDFTSVPDFEPTASFIKDRVEAMRVPARQWADLARLAIQDLPHDAPRLAELADTINSIRAELRSAVLVASEHFTEDKLQLLRKNAGMSKYAWRTAKKTRAVTTRHGFSLVIY